MLWIFCLHELKYSEMFRKLTCGFLQCLLKLSLFYQQSKLLRGVASGGHKEALQAVNHLDCATDVRMKSGDFYLGSVDTIT